MSITATEFLDSLRDAIPETYPASRTLWGSDWTRWIAEALHLVAERRDLGCCCLHGGHAHRATNRAADGHHREYLWDFTWYDGWDGWELPVVAIEHENQWSEQAFLLDHWKLMSAHVPLRVSFGYTSAADGWERFAKSLREISERAGWRFPERSEDLVLLGHKNMEPRAFRVLHRATGSREWSDLGSLEDWSGLPS